MKDFDELRDKEIDELRGRKKELDELKKKKEILGKETKPIKERPKIIAVHDVVKGDTLSGIALKYYGNAGEPYYMHIYNNNKGVIGDDPNMIMVGIKLQIFELPEDLKGK